MKRKWCLSFAQHSVAPVGSTLTHRSEKGRALAVLARAHAAEIGDIDANATFPGRRTLHHVPGHQRLDRDALPDVETEGRPSSSDLPQATRRGPRKALHRQRCGPIGDRCMGGAEGAAFRRTTAEAEGGVARFAIRPAAIITSPSKEWSQRHPGRRLGRHVMRRLATSPGACAPSERPRRATLPRTALRVRPPPSSRGDGLGAPPFGPQALQQIDTGLGPCGHGGLLRRAPMARPTAPFLRPFRRQHEEGPEAQRARALQISPSDQNGMSSLRS